MSYFDDNEDRIVTGSMDYERGYNDEYVSGKLIEEPLLSYTKNKKALCKVLMRSTEEDIILVAWEDLALDLKNYKIGQTIKLEGYRKFNTFSQKEEFIIKEILC